MVFTVVTYIIIPEQGVSLDEQAEAFHYSGRSFTYVRFSRLAPLCMIANEFIHGHLRSMIALASLITVRPLAYLFLHILLSVG